MKNQKRRKTWLIVWSILLLLSFAAGGYNWMQARQITSEIGDAVTQQANSLSGQASVSALRIQREREIEMLKLHHRLRMNGLARILIVLLVLVFGVLTFLAYRRLKRSEKEIDPQSLIDEIGS